MNGIKPDYEYSQVNNYDQLTGKGYELVIDSDGNRWYCLDGKTHRENAPATIYTDGYQGWLIHNKWHRLDGPARTHPDGRKEYWIDHKHYYVEAFHIKQLICYICNYQANSKEDYLVHADKEMENGKVFDVNYLII